MEQPEFEQAVLQMAHKGGVDRLTPSAVAYQIRVSVKDAERMLDKMVTNAQLELDSDDDGNLFYFVPGLGTPGVFTSGTASANPIDPPEPPSPAPASPYGQYAQGTQGAPPPSQPGYGQSYPPQPRGPFGPPPPGQPYGQPFAPQQQYKQPGSPPPPGQPYGQAQYGQPQYGQQAYGSPPPYAGQPGAPPPPYGQPGAPPPPYAGQPGAPPPPYAGQPYPSPPQYGQPLNAYGQPYTYGQNALVPHRARGPKSPAASALLSAMFPGAGQLYNGQVGKGLGFFFASLIAATAGPATAAILFVPWVWGIIDAYSTTRRQNAKQHYGLLNP